MNSINLIGKLLMRGRRKKKRNRCYLYGRWRSNFRLFLFVFVLSPVFIIETLIQLVVPVLDSHVEFRVLVHKPGRVRVLFDQCSF